MLSRGAPPSRVPHYTSLPLQTDRSCNILAHATSTLHSVTPWSQTSSPILQHFSPLLQNVLPHARKPGIHLTRGPRRTHQIVTNAQHSRLRRCQTFNPPREYRRHRRPRLRPHRRAHPRLHVASQRGTGLQNTGADSHDEGEGGCGFSLRVESAEGAECGVEVFEGEGEAGR